MHSAALPPRQCLQNGPRRPEVLAAGATTVDIAATTADGVNGSAIELCSVHKILLFEGA